MAQPRIFETQVTPPRAGSSITKLTKSNFHRQTSNNISEGGVLGNGNKLHQHMEYSISNTPLSFC